MNPHVARVVPDMLGLDLEGEVVRAPLPVFFSVPSLVASAPDIAAYEADPEVVRAVAYGAEGGVSAAERRVCGCRSR